MTFLQELNDLVERMLEDLHESRDPGRSMHERDARLASAARRRDQAHSTLDALFYEESASA